MKYCSPKKMKMNKKNILLALTYCHHQSPLREKAKILNVPKSIIGIFHTFLDSFVACFLEPVSIDAKDDNCRFKHFNNSETI